MTIGSDASGVAIAEATAVGGKTVAQMLGEIVWVMSQSPIHKQLFIGDLEWFAMPAILLEQFRIFYGPEHPAGVALWARVSTETDERLRAGAHKLRADEWRGGNIPWLIELIAPFGAQDEMLKDFGKAIFSGEAFNFHKATSGGGREVVAFNAHVTDISH